MCDVIKTISLGFILSNLSSVLIGYYICGFSNHSGHEVNKTDDAVSKYFNLRKSPTFADPFQTSCIHSYHNSKV